MGQRGLTVAVVVTGNAGLTQLVRGRDASWETVVRAFVTTLLVNVAVLVGIRILLPSQEDASFVATAFFLLLISDHRPLRSLSPPAPYDVEHDEVLVAAA